MNRLIVALGWFGITAGVVLVFVIAGADPDALGLILVLGGIVATAIVGGGICWVKGRRPIGTAGMLAPGLLPIAHFSSTFWVSDSWAPTMLADLTAMAVVTAVAAVVGITACLPFAGGEAIGLVGEAHMRRFVAAVAAAALMAACGDPAADPSTRTTVDETTTSTTIVKTTTTSSIVVLAPGLGHLLGTVTGWPPEAVSCTVDVVVWGPWPHRVASPACTPGTPAQFEFPFLPEGDWRVRIDLSWSLPDGSTGRRVNEFPQDPADWIRVPSGMIVQPAFDVVDPSGGVAGTMRDRATEFLLGGQYEPGAPIMIIVVHDAAGQFVTATGNRCDGTYELWLPEGRYALSLMPAALDPQPWETVWLDGTPVSGDPWTAIDPGLVPEGAWVEFHDAIVTDLHILVDTAPGADAIPWAWYREPSLADPLPADDPWRDSGYWIGHTATFDTAEWPPRLTRDGAALPLHGFTAETVRGGRETIAVVARVASGVVPSFRVLLAIDATGVVTDALVVDTGLLEYVTADGIAPHRPGVGLIVLAERDAPCEIPDDPAVRAWAVVSGALQEIDPTGAGVIPAG